MRKPAPKQVADALASIEIASAERIEATIGPAEVVTAPEWTRVRRADLNKWEAQLERAVNAEARAARLARDLEEAIEQAANDRRLMHAALRKSRESARPWAIATGMLAVALVWCLVALWRLA